MTSELQIYTSLLTDVKERIRGGQFRAAQSVNAELIQMYWDIGHMLHERQEQQGWGAGIIPKLARDIVGEFKPEHTGKMNFYCSVVDEKLRHSTDQPTIGLILCQTKDRILAEYALRGIQKPIGVSDYELTRTLPEDLKSSLPSIEELEAELSHNDENTP